jgi:RND family efflux transporter MFP subunit
MGMNRKHIYFMGAAVLSLVLVGCQVRMPVVGTTSTGAAPQKIERAQPTTAKVIRQDIVGYRILDGKVYVPPGAQANVVAATIAPIQTIDAKVGDHVARGQVLMTLATGQQDYYTQAKTSYDASKAAYDQALTQYEQPVHDLQQQLIQARAAEKTARLNAVPGGDNSDLQTATENRRDLESQLAAAQATAKSNELTYKQQLSQAATNLQNAREGKQSSQITSPISGTVTEIVTQPGQTPDGKSAVATIVDLPSLLVKADVLPDDKSFVKRGSDVVIVFRNYPDHKFDGKVTRIDALPTEKDGESRYAATVSFANTDGMIKPNDAIRSVGIVAGHRRNVITVPVDALAKDADNKPVVRVQQPDGSWKMTSVQLGMTDGNFVEVKSGLDVGETVQVVPNQGDWFLRNSTFTQ